MTVKIDAFVGFTLAILLLYFFAALGLNTDMRMLARGGARDGRALRVAGCRRRRRGGRFGDLALNSVEP